MLKKAALLAAGGCMIIATVPAHAALLVNWETGEYREVSWELCYLAGQNLPNFQCFGGLSQTNDPLSDEQTKEAVQAYEGKAVPPEPTAYEVEPQLRANINTSRSNTKGTVAAPNDKGNGGTASAKASGSNSDTELTVGKGRGISAAGDIPSEDVLPISDKRKCIKSGGAWVTNSIGSFCLKSLGRE